MEILVSDVYMSFFHVDLRIKHLIGVMVISLDLILRFHQVLCFEYLVLPFGSRHAEVSNVIVYTARQKRGIAFSIVKTLIEKG